jgi:ribosomal protein L37AE/L43A
MINVILNQNYDNSTLECPPHHLISRENNIWHCKKCDAKIKIFYEESKSIRIEQNAS